MRRAIGYSNLANEDQAASASAEKAIAEWCSTNKVYLSATFIEKTKGPVTERLELGKAIRALPVKGVLLVVLNGEVIAIERRVKQKMEHSGDIADIMAMVADDERQRISAVTVAGMAAKKNRRERVGSIPFGFRLGSDGVHLIPCSDEGRMIHVILDLRAQGFSYQKISDTLNDQKFPSRGKQWYKTTIHRICVHFDSNPI